MSEVAVTYQGPKGAYHVEDTDGTWRELVRGVPCEVSEALAEKLLELEDHEVTLADEVPAPAEPTPPYEVTLTGGSQDGETGETESLDPIPDPEGGEYRFDEFDEGVAVFEWHEDPDGVKPTDP